MHFQIALSTLDSLKSVFNEFRTKPSLGAPETRRTLYETNGNPHCPTSQVDWNAIMPKKKGWFGMSYGRTASLTKHHEYQCSLILFEIFHIVLTTVDTLTNINRNIRTFLCLKDFSYKQIYSHSY